MTLATQTRPVISMYEHVLAAPMSVLIEVTRRCNLRCLHCFSDSGPAVRLREMSTEQMKSLLDRLAEIGVFLVYFGGGEPLCRKDLLEIAAHTRKVGLEMCLLSNLTLIRDETARRLKEVGFFVIEGNLDGHNAEVYERLRTTKGSFAKTIRGIRACLDAGLRVRLNCALTKLNHDHIEDVAELARSLGVRDLAYLRLIPAGRGDTNFQRLDFGEPFYESEILPRLRALEEKYKGELGIGYEQNTASIEASDPHRLMPHCGAGRIHCTITPDGRVKPDHSFPDEDSRVCAGNVLDDDILRIWRESDVFHVIRQTRYPICNGCEHRGCEGGDVYRSYNEHGSLMAGPDPRCPKLREVAS